MDLYSNNLFCKDLPSSFQPEIGKILVTGATGYIGGRLVPELLARGYQVRLMVRSNSSELKERFPDAEIFVADALDYNSLKNAMEGIHSAYYLIHSLLLGKKRFESADIQAAANFRKAAEERNLKRIIYLGGLGDTQATLSPHLKSRIKVAEELNNGSVPVTILRAAIIIGSGSASYEIIKHLVEKVPLIFIPYWAKTKCQPIGIRDVIKYLVGVLEVKEATGNYYDIGGSDILPYEMMFKMLATLTGRKRIFIPSLVSSIQFFSYIASLITTVPAPITRSLMEGIKNEVVCQNEEIKRILPFKPLTYEEAVVGAMTREEQDEVYTRWSDAYPPAHGMAIKLHELRKPPLYSISHSLLTMKKSSFLFLSICKIGGKEGWHQNNWMWRLRGFIDRILLGVGISRGRRSACNLRVNDVIDFWRVEDLIPNKRLLLRAEMKLPGRSWLEFNVNNGKDKNRLSVKAYFQTRTFFGKLYWFMFLPLHHFIFINLLKDIERETP